MVSKKVIEDQTWSISVFILELYLLGIVLLQINKLKHQLAKTKYQLLAHVDEKSWSRSGQLQVWLVP